jgi:tRNA A-37 threonylcarbamoyl transferase component Bud32
MLELDAETLAERAMMIGLVSSEQAHDAKADAEDGSPEAFIRALLRKGSLTRWQVDRLQKGDMSGFFFGGCKIHFHLAEGTFARVYRGERMTDHKPVAVKVLRHRFTSNKASVATFQKEAESGMSLRHPNIVQILDYGDHERKYYMIMEYVEGSNLRDLLKIRGFFDAEKAFPIMLGLAHGLKYSLDHGVTHRDLKASNILIGTRGEAKLVDFGLATIEGEDAKTASLNPRTVDYSALERTCGSPKGDARSDIFFLGCVFYQMLTGQPPMLETETKDMLSKMLKRSFGAIKPLSEHQRAPDPELCRIIEKMMKVDLSVRYQTIGQVIHDLETYDARKHSGALAVAEVAASDSFLDEPIFTYQLPAQPAAPAGEAKHQSVLCVEAQAEIQEAFRKVLAKMGYRVLIVGDAERAAERYREATPDAVIFDVDGLGHAAVDAFIDMHDKAHEDGHPLAALVLLGPKQKALRQKLPTDDRLVVLDKPVKMKEIQDAISQLVPVH